jgi:transcriptional regulator with XRE-family HTH domain
MIPFRQQLGHELRARRLSQGRSLIDVAGAAHISHGYLSEIERGQKEASSELLAAICGALGVTYQLKVAAASTGYEPGGGQGNATGG